MVREKGGKGGITREKKFHGKLFAAETNVFLKVALCFSITSFDGGPLSALSKNVLILSCPWPDEKPTVLRIG